MRKYSVVQAGPNTQFGGANSGLTSSAYQPDEIAGIVNTAPITPASSEMATAVIICRIFPKRA